MSFFKEDNKKLFKTRWCLYKNKVEDGEVFDALFDMLKKEEEKHNIRIVGVGLRGSRKKGLSVIHSDYDFFYLYLSTPQTYYFNIKRLTYNSSCETSAYKLELVGKDFTEYLKNTIYSKNRGAYFLSNHFMPIDDDFCYNSLLDLLVKTFNPIKYFQSAKGQAFSYLSDFDKSTDLLKKTKYLLGAAYCLGMCEIIRQDKVSSLVGNVDFKTVWSIVVEEPSTPLELRELEMFLTGHILPNYRGMSFSCQDPEHMDLLFGEYDKEEAWSLIKI